MPLMKREYFKYTLIILIITIKLINNSSSVFAQDQFTIDSIQAKYNSRDELVDRVNYLFGISTIYLQSDINKSFDYADKAYVEAQKGDLKPAIASIIGYYSVGDSISKKTVIEKTTLKQQEYEFKDSGQRRRQEYYGYRITMYSVLGIVIFLFTVFILMILRYKKRVKQSNNEKENLEKELELKNRELTTNVMYLLRRHELINNISTRLKRLKSKLTMENKEVMQKIIFDLQAGSEPEAWEEFEIRFENVHTDFYKKLRKVASDLTPSELKLCAFLRLNMNSKEISALIHQSTKSIEVKRSRIRKKLGITNTDVNLVKYLSEL